MSIEEYKKELENWKEEHTNFYNECLHAMKNRKATLAAFMHIYDYAMSELPSLPEQVELGACEDLFMIYHEKSSFNGMSGMLNLLCYYDKIFYAQSISGCRILTGDRQLRNRAEERGITVSGILYVFDLLVEHGLIPPSEAAQKLETLFRINPRLPKREREVRIEKWRKS